MDKREPNEHYSNIAYELIDEREELQYIRDSEVTIMCLSSQAKKKSGDKIIRGQCEKIPDKYKWGIPCDFTITIFEPNIEGFTEEQLRILIFHELLHVGIDDEKLYVVKHDLEDFKVIIDEFGVDWDRTQ